MKYTKVIKRETKVMIAIVAVLLVMVLGASYALFLRVASSQNDQVVKTGTLQVSYDSTNGYLNGNTYPDLLPMSDENGLLQSGYSFSVKNTGNLKTEYTVYIYVEQKDFDRDHSGESLFTDLNSLRYNFRTNSDTNTTVNTIGTQTKVTEDGIDKYVLYTGKVEGTNSQNNHVFRVWLDPAMATSNIGKYVYLKLEVQSGVDTTPEPTTWQPTYFAFGQYGASNFPTSSTEPPTGYNVYAAMDSDGNRGICINRGGQRHCFKLNDSENEINHLQQVFSDINCSSSECIASDFDCYVGPNNGSIYCRYFPDNSICYLNQIAEINCHY